MSIVSHKIILFFSSLVFSAVEAKFFTVSILSLFSLVNFLFFCLLDEFNSFF